MNYSLKYRLTILLICLLGTYYAQSQVPKNIKQAINGLKRDIPPVDLEKFKNLTEEEAVISTRFTIGTQIRNNWIHKGHRNGIGEYFVKKGVNQPEVISAIIIRSLHRNLHGLPINLDSQIKPFLIYRAKLENCEIELEKKASNYFNRYNVGDKIAIYMPIETTYTFDSTEQIKNAVVFDCPNADWQIDKGNTLVINGNIIEKRKLNRGDKYYFDVLINSVNMPEVKILNREVHIHDVVEFALKDLKIA